MVTQDNSRLTIEFVREQFRIAGCTLVSEQYINARTPLKYICGCGTESNIRYDNFRTGKRCKECRTRKVADAKRHSIQFILEEFKKGGCTLLATKYINGKTPLEYICECGNKSLIRYDNFKSGSRCESCRIRKISGKNSPHYKPHLTDEDRKVGRNDVKLREWRKQVFERDDYTCYKCNARGKGELNAHHLQAYNAFPELRYSTSNGITLCVGCHLSFHKEFGFGDNTVQQLIEWTSYGKVDDF